MATRKKQTPTRSAPTLSNLKRLVRSLGGVVEADGMGGYEFLANAEATRLWIDAEVWCYVLPLNEVEPEEHTELIETAMSLLRAGSEPL